MEVTRKSLFMLMIVEYRMRGSSNKERSYPPKVASCIRQVIAIKKKKYDVVVIINILITDMRDFWSKTCS